MGCLREQSALPLRIAAPSQSPRTVRRRPFSTVVGSVAGVGFAMERLLNRSELEVQFVEAPEQKGAVPFEPTSACRTVLGL